MTCEKWRLGDQEFDPRFDFFLCPTHGLIVPSRFEADWTTDDGCPVPQYDEEPCNEPLTAVFLDNLVPDSGDDGEGRVEYRVVADPDNGAAGHQVCGSVSSLGTAEAERDGFNPVGFNAVYSNVRIQSRRVIETDWTDLPTQTKEKD